MHFERSNVLGIVTVVPRALADVREPQPAQPLAIIRSWHSMPKQRRISAFRSMQRQRTTPFVSRAGPASTAREGTRSVKGRKLGLLLFAQPRRLRSAHPVVDHRDR